MTKQFSLLQLFNIVDGRLSTSMDDVYNILNHVCDTSLMTHHLPVAVDYLMETLPIWVLEIKGKLDDIIRLYCPIKEKNKEQFLWLMEYFKVEGNNTTHNIPQLKDEFNTDGFTEYMIKNSLLKTMK